VGAQLWYSASAPMVEQLRRVTSGIYYPYPDKLAASVLETEEPSGWLLMTFTREQLARANELLISLNNKSEPAVTDHSSD
jgi:hypothetical protein